MERKDSSSKLNLSRDFLEPTGDMPPPYLEDFFHFLRHSNEACLVYGITKEDAYQTLIDFAMFIIASKQAIQPWHLSYLNRRGLDYIFTMCARLRMPPDVRFTAALIFDRYMTVHTREAHMFINTLDMTSDKKIEQWTKTQCNIIRQLALRAVTAIQIASKDNFYHESLSNTVAAKILFSVGSPFTPRAVIRSEMRILRAIDYEIPVSPLVYMESALKILVKHDSNLEHVNIIWEHALLFMDLMFAYMNEIIAQFNINLANASAVMLGTTQRISIKGDWMLIGGSCLVCAIACVYGFDRADTMANLIGDVTSISAQNILDLSVAVLTFVGIEHQKLSHTCEECAMKNGNELNNSRRR